MPPTDAFREIARDVFVLRYPVFDVNVTLIVGGERAMLIDTLSTEDQAVEMLAAARRVTARPLVAVNTHHHYDHTFGNSVVAAAGAPIWAHEEAAAQLTRRAATLPQDAFAKVVDHDPELAAAIGRVTVRPPDHTVRLSSTVDLGDRPVELRYFGRGHTAGDLMALVPDVDLVIAGDLLEESAPPQFNDGYPLDWPDTIATLLPRLGGDSVVVPGHGAVSGRPFVEQQHADLAALAWLIRAGDADGAKPEVVAAKSPFGVEFSLPAVKRGYDQLAGRG